MKSEIDGSPSAESVELSRVCFSAFCGRRSSTAYTKFIAFDARSVSVLRIFCLRSVSVQNMSVSMMHARKLSSAKSSSLSKSVGGKGNPFGLEHLQQLTFYLPCSKP